MNYIERLNNKMGTVAEKIELLKQELLLQPNSLAIKASLESYNTHYKELEKELYNEKLKRIKEIIEIRLKGSSADGSISLDLLARLSSGLSGTILNAATYIQYGQRVNRIRSKEIHDIVNLKLAGISTGSTRLFITADSSPDLFGRSLAEESFKSTFNVLTANSEDALIEYAAKIGNDSVKSLHKFITSISSAELELRIDWNTPTNETMEWVADKEELLKVAQSLNHIQIVEPQSIDFEGELIAISLKNKFELKLLDGITIKGIYPNELLDTVKTLTVGANYKGTFTKKTVVNSTTSAEKYFYSLNSISTE